MGMLREPFRLEDPSGRGDDIRDLEAWCNSRLTAWLPGIAKRYGGEVSSADRDTFLAYLVSQAVVLQPKYDPSRGERLSHWLLYELYRDLLDFVRPWWGSHGQHRVHGDAARDRDGLDEAADPLEGVRPDPGRAGEEAAVAGAFARMLDERSGSIAWQVGELGLRDVRRAETVVHPAVERDEVAA